MPGMGCVECKTVCGAEARAGAIEEFGDVQRTSCFHF